MWWAVSTMTTVGYGDRYPQGVRGFEGPPGSVTPWYAGNRKREWRFGETTDDTENTIAVARAILQVNDHRLIGLGERLADTQR